MFPFLYLECLHSLRCHFKTWWPVCSYPGDWLSSCCCASALEVLSGRPLDSETHCGELRAAGISTGKWQNTLLIKLWQVELNNWTMENHLKSISAWYVVFVAAPVCRGGCREYTRGTVGRVRNTQLVLVGLPKRSTGPQLQSGYNQLQKQLGRNTDWSIIYFYFNTLGHMIFGATCGHLKSF